MSYKEYINYIKQNINDIKKLLNLKYGIESDFISKNLTIDEYGYIIAYLDGVLDCKLFGGK